MRKGDFIFVKNLLVKAVSGVDGWQRYNAQPILLNIAINSGQRLKRMALTDDLRRSLNYDMLSTTILQKLEEHESKNIESTVFKALRLIQSHILPGETVEISADQPKSLLQAKVHSLRAQATSENVETHIFESLKGFDVRTIIGINDLERERPQRVELEISVKRLVGKPLFNNNVAEMIYSHAEKGHFLTIESFVNYMAKFVLEFPVEEVTVKAAKPNALNMANEAAVQVTRKKDDFVLPISNTNEHTVYIAFGTNQGDRIGNIRKSVNELSKRGISVEISSNIYESAPMYFTDQPRFLNGVFKCKTALDPFQLLSQLKDIEYNVFERVKLFDNGPRTFDLDIILYDNEVIESETLSIPHRDMNNRSFVLRPLNDLLPKGWRYPLISDGERTVVPLKSSSLEFDPFTHQVPTKVMAIMNATPDSFSDGGELKDFQRVAKEHIKNGATILDVGGYSTRPGAEVVDEAVEIERVCHAIKEIRKADQEVVISVDTFRGPVAKAAIEAGAQIINDVFSGTQDPSILTVAAETATPIILSHSRGDPQTMSSLCHYDDLISDVAVELKNRIKDALKAGCQTWQLILDPGLGFAKTAEQDLQIVKRFKELQQLVHNDGIPQLPWLVGPSRKSFIGYLAHVPNAKDRDPGTAAVLTSLREQGASIARVHDVKGAAQALKIADQIYS